VVEAAATAAAARLAIQKRFTASPKFRDRSIDLPHGRRFRKQRNTLRPESIAIVSMVGRREQRARSKGRLCDAAGCVSRGMTGIFGDNLPKSEPEPLW
jgi:hypothetical protein